MSKTTLMIMVLFLACQWSLNAQNAKLKKARHLMESLHYQGAIDIYQQILEKEEHPEAITNLAIAFKKLNKYADAIPWFAKAIALESTKPEIFYYYAQSLQHDGACGLAKTYFEQYLKLRPYDLRRDLLVDPCAESERLRAMESSSPFVVKNLTLNGPLDDLGPSFYQNGLVFGAIKEQPSRRKTAFFDLYFAARSAGDVFSFQEMEQFSSDLNSKLHEAIVTFNRNETEVYITRNRQEELDPRRNPVVRLEILSAQKQADGSWSDLQALPFNDPSYSVAHPGLSADGERLFFSSDMPGGFGGKDIYLSFWDGEKWGNPVNLGPGINTDGDEISPFYHESGTLYFASDGQFGLGGQDLYKVKDKENGQWSKPENLGPPINTKADDFGFIIHSDGTYGYFTSNRSGGQGADDIYGFTLEKKRPFVSYRFQVVDGVAQQKVEGVTVLLNEKEQILSPQSDGFYTLDVKEDDCFSLSFLADGYELKQIQDCAKVVGDNLVNEITIGMQKLKQEEVATTPVVAYDKVDEEELQYFDLEVVDNLSGAGVEAALVKIKGDKCKFEFEGETDERGWLRIAAPTLCCAKLTIESDNYFLHKSEEAFCNVKSGEVQNILLQPFVRVNEEAISSRNMASNPKDTIKVPFKVSVAEKGDDKISYLLNIYYNVGRTSVKKESVPELFKLLELLKDNDELIVEIGSHTDARGSSKFNQNLSQRRAGNIVTWLVGEGVSKRRLVARGYGEEKPVNNCRKEEGCTEKEYQMNRRTEFRVLGRLD